MIFHGNSIPYSDLDHQHFSDVYGDFCQKIRKVPALGRSDSSLWTRDVCDHERQNKSVSVWEPPLVGICCRVFHCTCASTDIAEFCFSMEKKIKNGSKHDRGTNQSSGTSL